MTQNHRTQGDVERFVDPFDAYGVTGLNDDLPERADMPRIMDERHTHHLVTDGIVAWCKGCGKGAMDMTHDELAHRTNSRITRDGSQVTR